MEKLALFRQRLGNYLNFFSWLKIDFGERRKICQQGRYLTTALLVCTR